MIIFRTLNQVLKRISCISIFSKIYLLTQIAYDKLNTLRGDFHFSIVKSIEYIGDLGKLLYLKKSQK